MQNKIRRTVMAESAELKTLREKVERYLREMDVTYQVAKGYYRVNEGSSAVNICPVQSGEQETILRLYGVVLRNVKKQGNEAMFEEFSELNSEYFFAKIYWEPNQDDKNLGGIWCEVSLLGEYLDYAEFKRAIAHVAIISDELDDKLKAKYGGELFID
jgi:hypothetical protein